MAKKPVNWKLWAKVIVAGAAISVGGPMLTIYLTPSEEEIFKRYNPDLQRRSLAERHTRQQEFDDFVMRLKAYSKSDKPIWVVMDEEEKIQKANVLKRAKEAEAEANARKEEMRKETNVTK
ncbi:hypothetical protein TD95_002851 [Thielaviopsis punctulata]|uniref:Cytochrome b mRNA-processing protein 4 n=1 Tax=Thielaviopsis punctulata TaxID=72032 RepID=A0A0F4ZF07_9PEZI|nr:hypothetical protein TD95_002851 [Thielaviopsis punctulata]